MTQGAFAITINNEKNKILLVRRKDGPIWDLPGGRQEKNENTEMCAVRETLEETGFEVNIVKKIGEYYRPSRNDTQNIFLAEVIGGQAISEGDETSKVKWFRLKRLPLLMVPHRKEQIRDFINGNCDIRKTLKDDTFLLKIANYLRKQKG